MILAAALSALPLGLAQQAAAITPPPIEKGDIVIELETVATGLTSPNLLIPSSDGTGRLFVTNQSGEINIIQNGVLQSELLLDTRPRLVTLSPGFDERGLLGLAFHPGFADPQSPGYQRFYTYTSEPVAGAADFTVPMPQGSSFNHQAVIAEWQINPLNPSAAPERREVMRIDQPQFNHNGGMIAFRPSDSYLYIALGDGGASNDSGAGHNPDIGNSQDLSNVLGAVLRIDPLGSNSANGQYGVPADNPFINDPAAVNEIWAYGLRNPWRFSFDAATDDMLIADVGQRRIEEINRGVIGGNYGWAYKEGTFLFNRSTGEISEGPDPIAGLIDPIAQYTNRDQDGNFVDGTAIIGGFVYRGALVPQLHGRYVFGDFTRFGTAPPELGRLFYMDPADESGLIQEFIIGLDDRELGLYLLGFGLDDAGEMYVLGSTSRGPMEGAGMVLKIVPEPTLLAPLAVSALLLARRPQRARRRAD